MTTHNNHGRITPEDTPNFSDCPCVGSLNQKDCAADGCGYCKTMEEEAAKRRERKERHK